MKDQKANVQQLAAEMYLSKRDRAAAEIAARAGTPYEHESVSDQKAYELFWQRDPDADEQRAWMEAAALVQSGKLEPDRLAARVVEKVYPARIAVVEGGGRTDLKAQTAFARRMVERHEREMNGGAAPPIAEPSLPEQEAPAMSNGPESVGGY